MSRVTRIGSIEYGAPGKLEGLSEAVLVTCPIALFPATSESEKISFNQINKNTGNRIKYVKVDAETGDDVEAGDIIKGYKVDTETYVTLEKDELEAVAIESSRTIEIDEFVPRSQIDDLYIVRPYFLVPDGKVGHDAYAVIRAAANTSSRLRLATRALSGCCSDIPTRSATRASISMTFRM